MQFRIDLKRALSERAWRHDRSQALVMMMLLIIPASLGPIAMDIASSREGATKIVAAIGVPLLYVLALLAISLVQGGRRRATRRWKAYSLEIAVEGIVEKQDMYNERHIAPDQVASYEKLPNGSITIRSPEGVPILNVPKSVSNPNGLTISLKRELGAREITPPFSAKLMTAFLNVVLPLYLFHMLLEDQLLITLTGGAVIAILVVGFAITLQNRVLIGQQKTIHVVSSVVAVLAVIARITFVFIDFIQKRPY